MKDIFGTAGKILGLIFAALVICYTSLLTIQLSARLTPGNTVLQFMTLVLFDGAAFVWFIQFITQAKATLQWAIAGIGFIVGLLGAVVMAGGELILGQSLVAVDDPSKIGWVLVATVILAALAHATLIYLFHFTDPETKNKIENAQEVSKALEHAYKDARAEISRNVDTLTAGLVESVLFEAQQQIGAATAAHIRNAARLEARAGESLRSDGAVIEATVKTPAQIDPQDTQAAKPGDQAATRNFEPGDLVNSKNLEPGETLAQPVQNAQAIPPAFLALLAAFMAQQKTQSGDQATDDPLQAPIVPAPDLATAAAGGNGNGHHKGQSDSPLA